VEHYREDVERRAFPSDEESYHLPDAARKELAAEPAGGAKITRMRKA